MKSLLSAAALVALPLAAQAADDITHVRYACDGDRVLDVVFVNTADTSFAVIDQMGELIPMRITPMASGASYKAVGADHTYVLHTKGDTADLVGAGDEPVLSNCTARK